MVETRGCVGDENINKMDRHCGKASKTLRTTTLYPPAYYDFLKRYGLTPPPTIPPTLNTTCFLCPDDLCNHGKSEEARANPVANRGGIARASTVFYLRLFFITEWISIQFRIKFCNFISSIID